MEGQIKKSNSNNNVIRRAGSSVAWTARIGEFGEYLDHEWYGKTIDAPPIFTVYEISLESLPALTKT